MTHNVREAVRLGDRVVLMATRPGRVKLDEPISLARPRVTESDVAYYVGRIMKELRTEVEKVMREEIDDAWQPAPGAVSGGTTLWRGRRHLGSGCGGRGSSRRRRRSARSLWAGFADGTIPRGVAVSLRRLAVGYSLSLSGGVALGLALARSRRCVSRSAPSSPVCRRCRRSAGCRWRCSGSG